MGDITYQNDPGLDPSENEYDSTRIYPGSYYAKTVGAGKSRLPDNPVSGPSEMGNFDEEKNDDFRKPS